MSRVMNPNPNNVNPPSMVRVAMDPRNPIVYEIPLQREWGRDDGWMQPPETTGNKNFRPLTLGGPVPDPEEGYFPTGIPLDDVIDRMSSTWPSFHPPPDVPANLNVLYDYDYICPPDVWEFPSDTTKKIAIEVNKQPPDVRRSEATQRRWKWEAIRTHPRPWKVPPYYHPDRRGLSDYDVYFKQPTKKQNAFRVNFHQ